MASLRAIEVEWQFAVRDVDVFARWLGAARFAGGWTIAADRVLHLRDAYFDTADWRLARAGYALRVRRSRTEVEATLKALRRARGGVARRREISEPLHDARPRSLRSARGAVGRVLAHAIGARPLRRLFALRTRRRTFAVCHRGRVVAELALDRTTILASKGRTRRLERVEVEVKAGAPALVARFATTLRRRRRLKLSGRSKFESGLAAAGLPSPRG